MEKRIAYLQKTGTKRIFWALRKEPKSLLEDDFSPLYYMWLGATIRGAYAYVPKSKRPYLDMLDTYYSRHSDTPTRLQECYGYTGTLPYSLKAAPLLLVFYIWRLRRT